MKCIPDLRISRLIIFTAILVIIRPALTFGLQASGFEVAGTEFQLVTIQPGTFTMDSDSHDGADGAPTDGSAWRDSTDRINRGVVRGGSFNNPPRLLRSYIGMRTPLGCRIHFNNGFRIAMSLN
ncbi:MAG: hypothetical protein A2168_02660 [Planctomycetes bacterium RBG_13_50_24]|nr:MAG: hypothetical protein A2168_02660 [Planctomycetes bacterium RBG_13_50_24]